MTIQIKSGQKIGGLEARFVRDLLRKFPHGLSRGSIERRLAVNSGEAGRIIRVLLEEGCLECVEQEKSDPNTWYRIAGRGRELMRASAAQRVQSSTAEQALAEFMERVHRINNDTRYMCSVRKAAVFGSFLGNKDSLGDVDVAVDIALRIPLKGDWAQKVLDYARNSERNFQTTDAELDWPRREVLLALKAKKRTISIHSWFSFISMEKSPDFKYRVLLGDPAEIRREIEEDQGWRSV